MYRVLTNVVIGNRAYSAGELCSVEIPEDRARVLEQRKVISRSAGAATPPPPVVETPPAVTPPAESDKEKPNRKRKHDRNS